MPSGTERQDIPAEGREGVAPGGDLSSFDQAINDLQGRISDLRVSVDELGGSPAAPPQPPAEPYAPPPEPPQFAPPEPPPADYAPPPPEQTAPPPSAYEPPQYEPPPPAYEPPAPEAAYPPPAYAPPPAPEYAEPAPEPVAEPPPEVFLDSPSPAAAMPAEGSDVLGSFSRVDIGPFEDLLAMTAFEEQLSALPSMADVRVRRFGAGRAEIEIETAGVVPVARELMRVAPDARPTVLPDGSLSIELTAERWTGGASAPQPEPEEAVPDEVQGAESEPSEPGNARG